MATARPKPSIPKLPESRERAILCARVAADNRGKDVLVLEMKERVDWVDYMVIVTGTSRRQIATVADEIEEALAALGDRRLGIEGYDQGSWAVLDYADLLVHIFIEEKRAYYQIEHLWEDAPRIEWQREPGLGP